MCVFVLFALQQVLNDPQAMAQIQGGDGVLNQTMIDTLKGATSEIGRLAGENPGADKFDIVALYRMT